VSRYNHNSLHPGANVGLLSSVDASSWTRRRTSNKRESVINEWSGAGRRQDRTFEDNLRNLSLLEDPSWGETPPSVAALKYQIPLSIISLTWINLDSTLTMRKSLHRTASAVLHIAQN